MKSYLYTVNILGLFLLSLQNVVAQQDTLLLYTKEGCSNCQAVKQAFMQTGIPYMEQNLANSTVAAEMLHKIAAAGYKDKIFLPVIFLKNKLYHPAYSYDTGLVALTLPNVVDSIKHKYLRGELHLVASGQSNTTLTSGVTANNADCELKTTPIYLICASYNSEKEAIAAMNKLLANGYAYAGIAFSQKQYRVYSKFFFDRNTANSELTLAKKTFNDAYLFEMP